MVRGEAIANINQYRAWPEFHEENSLIFNGCQDWNAHAERMNQQNPNVIYRKHDDKSVIDITRRMMSRLTEGTTKK